MPAVTVISRVPRDAASKPYARISETKVNAKDATVLSLSPTWTDAELEVKGVAFPTTLAGRSQFRLANGKALTAHAWKVYDLLLKVPKGKVTTYGIIAKHLGSSAQAVGGALRDNPFPPQIPCHRVVASDLHIGGFQGEWTERNEKGAGGKTLKRSRKLTLLEKEGVLFTENGYLVGGKDALWSPSA